MNARGAGRFSPPPSSVMSKMRRNLLLLALALFPVGAEALMWDSMHVIRRKISPFMVDLGDSLLEIHSMWYGYRMIFVDTTSQVLDTTEVVPIDDEFPYHTLKFCHNLGGGWIEIVGGRRREGENSDRHYLYRFHISDTGFVEERFREIRLPLFRYHELVDVERDPNGYMLVFYNAGVIGGDTRDVYAARINEAGETLWTRRIAYPRPNGAFVQSQWVKGITPDRNNPDQFVFWGRRDTFVVYRRINVIDRMEWFTMTKLDTSGNEIWYKETMHARVWYETYPVNINKNLFQFEDGRWGAVTMGSDTARHRTYPDSIIYIACLIFIEYNADGDSIDYRRIKFREFNFEWRCQFAVISGRNLMILGQLWPDPRWPQRGTLNLFYLDTHGDSLDHYRFSPDTVALSTKKMLVRPDGKLMVWVSDNDVVEMYRRDTDLLYEFYPDGRPGSVKPGVLPAVPERYVLYPAWPNPFNAQTTISYSLPAPGAVRLRVYDGLGRQVSDLSPRGQLGEGLHTAIWDASDRPAGIYLIRLDAAGQSLSRKVALVK